jgi:hypothetical protein
MNKTFWNTIAGVMYAVMIVLVILGAFEKDVATSNGYAFWALILFIVGGLIFLTANDERTYIDLDYKTPPLTAKDRSIWVATVCYDPVNKRYLAPKDPEKRILRIATLKEGENAEMPHVPTFRYNREKGTLEMLGHEYTFEQYVQIPPAGAR